MDATYTPRNNGSFAHRFSMPFTQRSVRYSSSLTDPRDNDDCHPAAALLEAGEAVSGRAAAAARIRKNAYSQKDARGADYDGEDTYHPEGKARFRGLSADPAAVFEQIRQATRMWVTIAACLLLLFVAGSTVYHWNWSSVPVPISRTPTSRTSSAPAGHAPDSRHTGSHPPPSGVGGRGDGPHAALHAALEKRVHIHQEEPHYAQHEKGEFDEDIMKQHPDDHSFVDIWDGDEHEDLHLSRGVPGLHTPLYRLPFVEGQHNETHVVGVHTSDLDIPKRLLVDGGQLHNLIGGDYDMLVTRDGRPKPLLVHGRLVWKKWAETYAAGISPDAMYLFYDHTHHTWVFNRELNFKKPAPVAFLPHGALLPVVRQLPHATSVGPAETPDAAKKLAEKRYTAYTKHGVPKGVHWVVREVPGGLGRGAAESGGPTVDAGIRVRGHPGHTAPEDFFGLSLQKVFHTPEEGPGDMDEEENVEDDEYLEDDESSDHHGIHGEYEDEDEEELEKMFVPEGTRTRQQYLTHPQTQVYHTFDDMHSKFDHERIVDDPIAYLEASGHPDVDTIEREVGDDTTAIPHPLRKLEE
ncbi:hypothetical protein NCLIV_037060 [Neospora caninum Liverpool]|uniref:Transmembrane protein n=1 Tax=Neospora caninum (strain Liverpool) TaxID=572307 RepID=F0VJL3_NEOCL|nr:hypothetical protein NCLIV_037060 [Neospora caninum Liverpool]CBZ53924.1 hypothetical protein NCLIV_037060 [Neospora caninum Liverpool]CEL67921.1 TPA: hypothetical protein BN1204_037060 [Neospora caninum Liverpool]|eukprot:XP_003883956.1 hypothetical protein NCLIV_037060 [Neospora caninum Liverpool]